MHIWWMRRWFENSPSFFIQFESKKKSLEYIWKVVRNIFHWINFYCELSNRRYKHFNLNTFLDEKMTCVTLMLITTLSKIQNSFSFSQNVDELLTVSNFLCQIEIAFHTFFNVSLYQFKIKWSKMQFIKRNYKSRREFIKWVNTIYTVTF